MTVKQYAYKMMQELRGRNYYATWILNVGKLVCFLFDGTCYGR